MSFMPNQKGVLPFIEGKRNNVSTAIMGLDGSLWARSADFPILSKYETGGLFNFIDNEFTLFLDRDKIGSPPNDLRLNKYLITEIHGVLDAGSENETRVDGGGIIIVRTEDAFLIGVYTEKTNRRTCLNAVRGMKKGFIILKRRLIEKVHRRRRRALFS